MKRFLAIVLSIMFAALVFGCVVKAPAGQDISAAVTTAAAEPTPTPSAEPTPEPTREPSPEPTPEPLLPIVEKIRAGETRDLEFGGYIWRVLDVQDGKALIIMEDILEDCPYHTTYASVTWETCALRAYLNNEVYYSFSEKDRERIIETTVQNPDNLWYGTKGGNDTQDYLFLLSIEEADIYFGGSGHYRNQMRMGDDGWCFHNEYDEDRKATYNGATNSWWLRSPGQTGGFAASVLYVGWVCVQGRGVTSASNGVRPALWLNLGD